MTARRAWLNHLGAATVFGLLTAIFFFPVLARGETFTTVVKQQQVVLPYSAVVGEGAGRADVPPQSDLAVLSHPWQVALTRAVNEGTIPFWDAHEFVGGYPLTPNGSSAQLYPPHLLGAAWLSPVRAHDVFSLLHVFLAGLLTYFLLRELGRSWLAGMLSGVSWMFASFNMGWLHFEVVAPVQVFLPLTVLLARRVYRLGTWAARIAAGVAMGICFSAGHVLWLATTVAIAATYLVCLSAPNFRNRSTARRGLLDLTVVGGTALAVGAVTLLPFLHAVGGSQHKAFTYDDLYRYFPSFGTPNLAPPRALLHILWPVDDLTVESLNSSLIFVGTASGVLALLAILSRQPGAALGRWLTLFFGLAAIGGPITWLAYHVVPMFRVLWPYGRWFQWASFGIALLAGIGLDRARDWLGERMPVRGRQVALGASVVLLAVTATQLLVAGRALQPGFAKPADVYPRTGLVDAIQDFADTSPWPARTIPLSGGSEQLGSGLLLGPGNHGDLIGADLVGGYDSVVPRQSVTTLRWLQGQPLETADRQSFAAFASFLVSESVRYDQLARFGITAMATPPAYRVAADWGGADRMSLSQRTLYSGPDGNLIGLPNPAAGPRVVDRITTAESELDAFRTYVGPGFPWEVAAVMTRSEASRLPPALRESQDRAPINASVTDIRAKTNSVELRVDSGRPGLLVVPQNWNAGWSAEIDGRSSPVLRANYTSIALAVPAGASHVVLRFEPVGFRLGALVSVSALALGGGVAGVDFWRGRRRRAVGGDDDLSEELVGEQPRG